MANERAVKDMIYTVKYKQGEIEGYTQNAAWFLDKLEAFKVMLENSDLADFVPEGMCTYTWVSEYVADKGPYMTARIEFRKKTDKDVVMLADVRPLMKRLRQMFGIKRFEREFQPSSGTFSWMADTPSSPYNMRFSIRVDFADSKCKITKKTKTVEYFEADCTEDRSQSKLFEEA